MQGFCLETWTVCRKKKPVADLATEQFDRTKGRELTAEFCV